MSLFYQIYLKCLVGHHRYSEGKAFIYQMIQGRTMTKRELKWLAEMPTRTDFAP